jgi:Cu2+-exporting ATPase
MRPVSLEWINGESEPVERAQGQLLPAGALNISSHEIEAEALESWEESTLRKLLEARRGQDARDLRLERVLRVYLALVVAAGVLGALGWWWAGAGIERALQIMISIFVVSCPCALGVAVPLAEELAALRAQRLGVFVRTLGFWKKLRHVQQVVFDKTGTLTLENPTLKNPEIVQALPAQARSALRRLVEGNLHPVSRSLYDQVGPGDRAGWRGIGKDRARALPAHWRGPRLDPWPPCRCRVCGCRATAGWGADRGLCLYGLPAARDCH